MKKEVEICDKCNAIIAVYQCYVCKGMFCKNCVEALLVSDDEFFRVKISSPKNFRTEEQKDESLTCLCDNCKSEIMEIIRNFYKIGQKASQKQFFQEFIDFIKERMNAVIVADKI